MPLCIIGLVSVVLGSTVSTYVADLLLYVVTAHDGLSLTSKHGLYRKLNGCNAEWDHKRYGQEQFGRLISVLPLMARKIAKLQQGTFNTFSDTTCPLVLVTVLSGIVPISLRYSDASL
jgi:hypothetical protein